MSSKLEQERLNVNYLSFEKYVAHFYATPSYYQTIYIDQVMAAQDDEIKKVVTKMNIVNERFKAFLFRDPLLLKQIAYKNYHDEYLLFDDDHENPDPQQYSLYKDEENNSDNRYGKNSHIRR